MIKLGVNIDYIALIRQNRKTTYPDLLKAALICEENKADGITVHLRKDRRHIQEEDVSLLKKNIKTKLNVEMSLDQKILNFVLDVCPQDVCIVPERVSEMTTEGGLDILKYKKRLLKIIPELKNKNIRVTIFVNPILAQIKAASEVGADGIELHTGIYAEKKGKAQEQELEKIKRAGELAVKLGLHLHAGHGLNYENIKPITKISALEEVNIGHSIIAYSIFVGLAQAVREMKELCAA